jgi:hypothetical protein
MMPCLQFVSLMMHNTLSYLVLGEWPMGEALEFFWCLPAAF